MPRAAVENNRLSLRIRSGDKATIMRASAIAGTGMTDFMLRSSLRAARDLIAESDRIALSPRDSRRVLELIENPPAPNARLRAAARALPRRK